MVSPRYGSRWTYEMSMVMPMDVSYSSAGTLPLHCWSGKMDFCEHFAVRSLSLSNPRHPGVLDLDISSMHSHLDFCQHLAVWPFFIQSPTTGRVGLEN